MQGRQLSFVLKFGLVGVLPFPSIPKLSLSAVLEPLVDRCNRFDKGNAEGHEMISTGLRFAEYLDLLRRREACPAAD